jgi:hypothetical protein
MAIRFKQEAPTCLRSKYVVTAFEGTLPDERTIRIVFIVGKRFAIQELGIRDAKDVEAMLDHPKLADYMRSTISKFERKRTFARSLYVIPEVNTDLAAYLDSPALQTTCSTD